MFCIKFNQMNKVTAAPAQIAARAVPAFGHRALGPLDDLDAKLFFGQKI